MANTYSQITIQVVIVVKRRENLLKKEFRLELFKYITGIVKNKKQKLLAINGVEDHVHILLGIDPSMRLLDLVRDIKNNSSKYINENNWLPVKFNWQAGYGAFSYSKWERPRIIKYIENQEEHHRKKLFREEYIGFLKKFEVEYDERYLFDFIE